MLFFCFLAHGCPLVSLCLIFSSIAGFGEGATFLLSMFVFLLVYLDAAPHVLGFPEYGTFPGGVASIVLACLCIRASFLGLLIILNVRGLWYFLGRR